MRDAFLIYSNRSHVALSRGLIVVGAFGSLLRRLRDRQWSSPLRAATSDSSLSPSATTIRTLPGRSVRKDELGTAVPKHRDFSSSCASRGIGWSTDRVRTFGQARINSAPGVDASHESTSGSDKKEKPLGFDAGSLHGSPRGLSPSPIWDLFSRRAALPHSWA